jgi:hypothetical protein
MRSMLLTSTLLVCLAGASEAAAQDPALHAEELKIRAEAANSCFETALVTYALGHPDMPVRYSGETGIYVSERIVATTHFSEATRRLEGPIFTLSPNQFCEQFLFAPYVAALPAAAEELRNESKGGLAPLGSDEIESTSILVEKYQNLIGKHYKGHSDITRESLQSSGAARFSVAAVSLVVRASQTPDLYRWSDGRYHAHTPEYDPTDLKARKESIAAGQSAYSNLICRLMTAFSREVRSHSYQNSLFLLGVMSHSVQDLTYHHGITMRQHAGLSYAAKRNPDMPEGSAAGVLESEAVANTLWVMEHSRKLVSSDGWDALTNWSPSGDFSFTEIARQVFGSEGGSPMQDISMRALLDYRFLSLPYESGARPMSDLADKSCAAEEGLACWSAPDVLKAVEDEIAGDRQCR